MKDRLGAILRPEQERYLERTLPPRHALLAELEHLAERDDIPISDPEVGRLLEVLARGIGGRYVGGGGGGRRIVEVGTAVGYGTLCLARGAPEAQVISIDNDPERLAVAREVLDRAGVGGRVELIEGDALEVLARLDGPIDLAYVDAVKEEYRRYLDLLLPQLRVGGLLVFDNLLWKGWIAEPPPEEEEAALEGDGEEIPADFRRADALRAFNGYLMMHPQLAAVILPLGDGVGLAAKTQPLVSELGGPF